MKKLLAILAFTAFSLVPFTADASCEGTFCGILTLECTSGPCSVTVNEDGGGSITCGGNTIPITCTSTVE